MRQLFIFLFVISFISCQSNSALSKQLSSSDSLVINFGRSKSDTGLKTFNTTEAKAIKKMIHFVDQEETSYVQCGYGGNLLFYSAGELTGDVAFNFSERGCEHFMIQKGKDFVATEMSAEAIDFFKSLAEGKGWY